MKRLFILQLCIILISCFFLASCAADPAESTGEPDFTHSASLFDPTAAQDSTETTKGPAVQRPVGTIQHGFGEEYLTNDRGRYNVYSGGEMHIEYNIMTSGNLGANGVGIILILDGQPQPYKTATDGTYSYMHVFYPKDEMYTVEEFIFTPVTGQSGDTLELSAFQVINPSYYPSESYISNMLTFGSMLSGTQLVFESTPPAMEPVEIPERVSSHSITYVDLTSLDTLHWSSEDLEQKVSFVIGSKNPIDGPVLCDVSADEPLTMYAEVFGATAVEWSLIFYVDNMPVSALEENVISFHTKSGMKTVIEVTLDMSDFDGEGSIFAVLYEKNGREPEVRNGTHCSTEITSAYYMTDVSDWKEFNSKYGRG